MAGHLGRCLVAVAAAVALVVSGCESTTAGTARPAKRGPLSPATGATPRPGQPGASPEDFLLSADEINEMLNSTDLSVQGTTDQLTDNSADVSDPGCVGTLYNAEEKVYDGTGWSSLADQILTGPDDDASHWVEQTVVAFDSHRKAVDIFNKSVKDWTNCIGKELTVDAQGDQFHWRIEGVVVSDLSVRQRAQQADSGGWACDHVLGVKSGYVIEAAVCGSELGDEAARLATRIAGKIG